jgi:hypothetical protein
MFEDMFAQKRVGAARAEPSDPGLAVAQVQLLAMCGDPAVPGLIASTDDDVERRQRERA